MASDLAAPGSKAPFAQSKILLVDAVDAERARLQATLAPLTGVCEARATLGPVPSESEFDVIVANYDDLAPDERATLIDRFAGPDRARLLLVSEGRSQEDLGALFGRHALTNLLARNGEVDANELVVTIRKIFSRAIFGLDRYFGPNANARRLEVTRSSDKPEVVESAAEYARSLGVHSRMVAHFSTIADELVTNAVYNAPCDADGKSRYAHLHRSDEVVLDPSERIVVTFCSDGKRIGIAADDPFGSLTRERLLDYLSKCFQAGKGKVERKAGGAGLGFYHIFDAVSHLVANIAPRKRTEIIGLLDARGSYRTFAQGIKSFNLFVGE